MSKLQATSGITDKTSKSFVDLERKAREMGSTTSFSATDAANGLTYLALAGWDVETQIDRIEPVLRAAEAGGMDLARCADLVTDSMSAAGVASEDFSKYLDITAQAQRKSNTSMEEMLEAYTVAGGMFDQLNMPLEKSGALLGVLANRGTKGSEAGNALISVFSNLITETGQAGDALEAMGISLYDSTGKQRDMVDVLKEMAQKLGVTADGTSDLTEQQKQQYAAMVGGKTQFDTLMKLLSGVSGEYDTLEDQLKNSNGALAEMAKIMKDNLGGSIDNMKSSIEGALIEAFKAMEPVLENIIKWITDAAKWFSNLDDSTQQTIVTIELWPLQ
ncbi:phage tail tape measure protein, TP901 family, core region [[Clostridium] sordellii ATCC 9714]|nr:phage tail tape measure protein, TP901 family, core region [[Clostridium] sordellii ATCC 9714] [Paeniclostridium sordellii ATCC 9714]